MNRRVLGVAGKPSAGKGSVSLHLAREHDFLICALADPIRLILHHVYDISFEQMSDRVLKEKVDPRWGKSPRQLMQEMGSEVGRSVHMESWTKHREIRIYGDFDWVISDIRFPNEIETIHELGGEVIWVESPVDPDPDVMAHQSEGAICAEDCDIVIDNPSRKLSNLHTAVDQIAAGDFAPDDCMMVFGEEVECLNFT